MHNSPWKTKAVVLIVSMCRQRHRRRHHDRHLLRLRRQRRTPERDHGRCGARLYLVDTNRAYAQVIEEADNLSGLTRLYLYGDDLISQSRISGNDVTTAQSDTYLYDGLGSVRTLTDSTGAITDTYTYEAFGGLDTHTGTTENRYLFTGEQFDPNVGFYYLRARYYNPSIGRFQTMDTYAGRMHEPQTLHKYLYVHANPVNNIDPSGLMSLAEASAASNIQAIIGLVARAEQGLRVYSRVQSTFDLLYNMRKLFHIVSGDLTAAIPRSFPTKVDFADAGKTFLRGAVKALQIGSPSWIAGYVKDYTRGRRVRAYVIYLPVVVPQAPTLVNTGRTLNGKPIKIGLGAPGGRRGSLGGVGLVMGKERMLFRMDIGATPTGHVRGRGSEIKAFDEGSFSFHVYDWRGGPR